MAEYTPIEPSDEFGPVESVKIGTSTDVVMWRQVFNGARQVFVGVRGPRNGKSANGVGFNIRAGFASHTNDTLAGLNRLAAGWLDEEDEAPEAPKQRRGRKAKA